MRAVTLAGLAFAATVAVACNRRDGDERGVSTGDAPSGTHRGASCDGLPNADDLKRLLAMAPDSGEVGGMFEGRTEWAAVVNRDGEVCAVMASTSDVGKLWPGSQQIARAKAFTANAFSTDTLALSTARLYTLTQPGHSLWGIAAGNPFNPACYATPNDRDARRNVICGGAIAFGGGVPLYKHAKIIGGLGVSGDTPCADHEIAKRMRDFAALNPPAGKLADDITYAKVDHASLFTHPLCVNTWRNGSKVGDEPPATGY